ncbi:unnamed protein product [Auanema sp. JU1783]|nr:unnamed protein product [Auanema sp. JU1783]
MKRAVDLDPTIVPISYDLQLQLPLSEVNEPSIPLFTGHVVLHFDLTSEIGLLNPIVREDQGKGAQIAFLIDRLDHFENVSLVHNGSEVIISNVQLTETEMQITVAQPVLFVGRYTLSVGRYKGFIGTALYYRDAGEHAVFGSSFSRAAAAFPTIHPRTQKVTFSISVIHPADTLAVSSAPIESLQLIDDHWQVSSFRTSSPIVPSLLALALIPQEYHILHNTYTGINLTVHYNEHRVQYGQAKQLLGTLTQIITNLKQLFSSIMAMPKLDVVVINDVPPSNSFGTIILPEGQFFSFDYENQIYHLTMAVARHWIGGLISIGSERNLCLQEDLLSYIAYKVVKRLTNDDHIRLAHYAKVSLTEGLFEPGFSLHLSEPVDDYKIQARCSLKGVTMLESLEFIVGEAKLMKSLNLMIYHSPRTLIDMNVLEGFLNRTIDDGIGSALLMNFWRDHGGLPNIQVDRFNNSIKIRQLLDNSTVERGLGQYEKMTLWPLTLEFTEFKLPVYLMLSQGIHLAPVRDGLALANLGFGHFYRVNYDSTTWKEILDRVSHNTTNYTLRERSQLLSDFCYFYSAGALEEPLATILRDEWLHLIRLQPSQFPLCELSAFRCLLVEDSKPLTEANTGQIRKRLFDALSSSVEMNCGKGAVHDAVNQLCIDLFDRHCF